MKRQQTYKGLIGNGWYDKSKYSHYFAAWANHRNNWAIRKADNRKLAKARLKQIERQQIRKELDEYDSRGENQEAQD
jgi:hypothetical protein